MPLGDNYTATNLLWGWWGIYPPTTAPCPSCGHCPACGRGGYMGPYPYYPTYPYQIWTTCGTQATGYADSTTGIRVDYPN